MAYVFLQTSDGQFLKVLSDANGVIQYTTNGADYVGLLNVADYDSWMNDSIALMRQAAPTLTNFKELSLTGPLSTSIATPGSLDPAIPGGGVANDAHKVAPLSASSLFQTPATTAWALAFRARSLATTGSNFNLLGLFNAAAGHSIGVAAYHAFDATDHYCIYTYDGQEAGEASTVAADTAFHDFVLGFDGTTISLFIDGELVATQTDLTGLTDEPMFAGMYDDTASHIKVSRYAYGYISP